MRILAQIFANNEFRVSVGNDTQTKPLKITSKEASDKFIGQSIDAIDGRRNEICDLTRMLNTNHVDSGSGFVPIYDDLRKRINNTPVLEIEERIQSLCKMQDSGRHGDAVAPLDFNEKNQEKCKTRSWGLPQRPKTFSKNARHILLEAGSVLRGLPKERCRFLTLTIPGNFWSGFQSLANWSGWFMNLFSQKIRDFQQKYGIEIAWLYAFEFQRRGALHLHILIADMDGVFTDTISILARRLYKYWFSLLLKLEEKTGCDLFGKWRDREDIWAKGSRIEIPRKDVAKYVSKYCSKGVAVEISSGQKNSTILYPARWWGCSQNLKDRLKAWRYKSTLENSGDEVLNQILDRFESFTDLASTKYNYDYKIERADNIVAWGHTIIFYFPSEIWEDLHSLIKEELQSMRNYAQYKSALWRETQIPINYQSAIKNLGEYPESLFDSLVDCYNKVN